MAFPASTQTLENGLKLAYTTANSLKSFLTARNAEMAAGDVSGTTILNILRHVVEAEDTFNTVAAISGIGDYAKAQFDDPTLNVVTEFTAMKTACGTVIDRLVVDIPKDANGWRLIIKITTAGAVTYQTFGTAGTANLRTDISTLIATIG